MHFELETERLILRDLRLADIDAVFNGINNPNVVKFTRTVPWPYKKEDAKWWVNKCLEGQRNTPRTQFSLAITRRDDNSFLGIIDLKNIDYFVGTATLGYWLREDAWGKGYMTEASKRIIEFAFNKIKLRRLNIEAFSDNKASNNVIKKLGFTLEGKRRGFDRSKITKEVFDSSEYGLLKEEWLKQQEKNNKPRKKSFS